MQGNVYIILAAYGIMVPITIIYFGLLEGRRAMLATVLTSWLFLPNAVIDIPALPDIDKLIVMGMLPMLGILCFDIKKLFEYRFRWADIPAIVFCLSPIATALSNSLGLWEGLSFSLQYTVWVGSMYFYGRIYITDLHAVKDLMLAILYGALIYLPLCWWEMRMSPNLHNTIYGYHANPFVNSSRYGGYRPVVFLANHLAVAIWMASASVIAFWAWRTKIVKAIYGVPIGFIALMMFVNTFLMRSAGAAMLMLIGIALYFAIRYTKSAIPLILIAVSVFGYINVRTYNIVSPDMFKDMASIVFSEQRVDSLAVRVDNELELTQKALERPVFGWGRYGRGRIYDHEKEKDDTLADSLWVIMLSRGGLVSMYSLVILLLMPAMLFVARYPVKYWFHPWVLPAVLLAVITLLYATDNLLNGKMSPIVNIAWGGLCSLGQMVLVSRKEYARQVSSGHVKPALSR